LSFGIYSSIKNGKVEKKGTKIKWMGRIFNAISTASNVLWQNNREAKKKKKEGKIWMEVRLF
jgi:hypothetical protein